MCQETSRALADALPGGNEMDTQEVSMILPLLFAHAFASAEAVDASEPVVHEATDPTAGLLVDVVEPATEYSNGVVLAATTPSGAVEIRELHAGEVRNDEVQVTDKGVQAHLALGEKVIVYRDAHGIAVVAGP